MTPEKNVSVLRAVLVGERGIRPGWRQKARRRRVCWFRIDGRDTMEGTMRPQPLIAVSDVEASSRWYQRLLGCRSAHGGRSYDQLVYGGELVMQLHAFDVEHHHGAIGDVHHKPYGNGVLLWFEVDDFDGVMARAAEMNVEIVMAKHRNPPDDDNGGPNHWECWMRDPDGYVVVVAGPYGTADGSWKPPERIWG
jgi:catechol 2,3-dioxygenase-like lactoylglutathione lyase family enzyme